ncbi:MAG TPA: STAS domain-containing protein [Acidimicrobiales bacterium]|nr:STAS domain-containing protein [Acidimicrobiales bacterium]
MVNRFEGAEVEVTGPPEVPRVRVSGELDLAGADAVRVALDEAIGDEAERVELDLGDLAFLDSSGLSVFIELAVRVPVSTVSASDAVRRVVTVTGVDEVLGLAP